ncbi:hypothetical protein FIBSPDRAFT_939391 [Athelia psychrophila]|uniref:Uncharacterized protein n=1 Tax=Athelia psychrophila TaxID=1759441 RepID=A0A165WGG2_9AGAM|nr:hypothetical protein FIBSPDRAFT_939391 [Fibularhizoctonia sp. CBS 109695]
MRFPEPTRKNWMSRLGLWMVPVARRTQCKSNRVSLTRLTLDLNVTEHVCFGVLQATPHHIPVLKLLPVPPPSAPPSALVRHLTRSPEVMLDGHVGGPVSEYIVIFNVARASSSTSVVSQEVGMGRTVIKGLEGGAEPDIACMVVKGGGGCGAGYWMTETLFLFGAWNQITLKLGAFCLNHILQLNHHPTTSTLYCAFLNLDLGQRWTFGRANREESKDSTGQGGANFTFSEWWRYMHELWFKLQSGINPARNQDAP